MVDRWEGDSLTWRPQVTSLSSGLGLWENKMQLQLLENENQRRSQKACPAPNWNITNDENDDNVVYIFLPSQFLLPFTRKKVVCIKYYY